MEQEPQSFESQSKAPKKRVSETQIYILAFVFIMLVTVAVGAYAYQLVFGMGELPNQTACTLEAKQCPDGSFVGRTGPNCEFAECPGALDTSTWKTYHNEELGFELEFPPTWDSLKTEKVNNKTNFFLLDNSGTYRDLCYIEKFDKENWETAQDPLTGPRPIYIDESGNSVYAWGCGQEDGNILGFNEYNQAIHDCSELDQCNNFPAGPHDEFKKLIIPTFKFLP